MSLNRVKWLLFRTLLTGDTSIVLVNICFTIGSDVWRFTLRSNFFKSIALNHFAIHSALYFSLP